MTLCKTYNLLLFINRLAADSGTWLIYVVTIVDVYVLFLFLVDAEMYMLIRSPKRQKTQVLGTGNKQDYFPVALADNDLWFVCGGDQRECITNSQIAGRFVPIVMRNDSALVPNAISLLRPRTRRSMPWVTCIILATLVAFVAARHFRDPSFMSMATVKTQGLCAIRVGAEPCRPESCVMAAAKVCDVFFWCFPQSAPINQFSSAKKTRSAGRQGRCRRTGGQNLSREFFKGWYFVVAHSFLCKRNERLTLYPTFSIQSCFKCFNCKTALKPGEVFEMEENPFCDACFYAKKGNKCARCNQVIKSEEIFAEDQSTIIFLPLKAMC